MSINFNEGGLKELKEHYDEHGWVLVKNIFSQGELLQFRSTVKSGLEFFLKGTGIEGFLSEDDFLAKGYPLLKDRAPLSATQFYDLLWGTRSFIKLGTNDSFLKCISTFLDVPQENLYSPLLRCRVDPPQDDSRTYGWHQEIFYTIPGSHYLQTWAPLINDIPESAGALRILDKSHNECVALQSWNELEGKVLQILADQSVISKYKKLSIETELGDALFFNKYTIHASGNNTTDRTRYSFVGMFHDFTCKDFKTPIFPKWEFRGKTSREYFSEYFGDARL